MSSPLFPKAYADFVQRLRVPSGFLLAVAFAWLARPTPATLLIGLPVCLAGLAVRAWAAGHLRKNQTLTTSGPYAWVRNPLYLGTLLMALGFTAAANRPVLYLFTLGVFVLVYFPVMQQEEQHLRTLFSDFDSYASRVRQVLPLPPSVPSNGAFSWDVYRANKEQKAFYGFLMVLAFFLVRMLLP